MEPMLKDRLTHHINDEVTTNAFMGDVLYQLARYEDTGFSVEELESLREKKLQKSVSVLHATAESYEENGKEQIDGTLDQISRQMTIEVLNREYLSGATVNMCGLEVAMDVIEELPSVQPNLYGYTIEHLAMIARIMEIEGISPQEAIRKFENT